MFSLLRDLNKHVSCDVNTLIKLFNSMVEPIALYNSEVWGPACLPINSKNQNLFNLQTNYKLPIEMLKLKFLKIILGVSKKASNLAVVGETNSEPLTAKIFLSMIKFYLHIRSSKSEILKSALYVNSQLAKNGANTWIKSFEQIKHFIKLENLDDLNVCQIKRILYEKFVCDWKKSMSITGSDSSKLNLFVKIKQSPSFSQYLSYPLYYHQRVALTKLRISNHNFPIETGRYQDIQRQQRW